MGSFSAFPDTLAALFPLPRRASLKSSKQAAGGLSFLVARKAVTHDSLISTPMVDQLTSQPYFDSLGHACAPHADGVNAAATAKMERVLKSPADAPGRGILLRAPRAGFGKTHLLSFVQQRLSTTHEFLPLNVIDGSRVDAGGGIEAALRRLTRPLPAGGGLTPLDFLARRIFSLALQPLVSSGEVPCQDREAALTALRQRPVETFDFHHAQAVTAQWTKENFEVLGPRLALELSRRSGSSLNESSFWLASLFRFAIAVPEHPGRTGMIIQAATSDAGVERYASFLALLSLIGRVVVVADDLEGMHAEPAAALRFASFLATLRQEAPRVDIVVSINDDIWESAFVPALSGGLQDRLGELEIRLKPLDESAMKALIEARAPDGGANLETHLNLGPDEYYARRVLRKIADLDEEDNVSVVPAPLFSREEASQVVPEPNQDPVAQPSTQPVDEFIPEQSVPQQLSDPQPEMHPADDMQGNFAPQSESPPPLAGAAPSTTDSPPPLVNAPSQSVDLQPEDSQAEANPNDEVQGNPAPRSDAPPPLRDSQTVPPNEDVVPQGVAESGEGEDRIDDLLRQFRERYGRE